MRNHLLVLALGVLLTPIAGSATDAQSATVVPIQYGKNNPICRDADKRLASLEREDFYSDSWYRVFDTVQLHPLEMPDILPYSGYAQIDIYNTGASKVVVSRQVSIGSVFFDLLYVLQPDVFQTLQASPNIDAALSVLEDSSTQLSPRNGVKFSNGVEAVPVSTHVWQHRGKNLLLMKEHFFAKSERGAKGRHLPNAFYVGILSDESSKFDTDYKIRRLYPKMVCRFVWDK